MSLDRALQVGGVVVGLIGGGLAVVYPTKWAGLSLVGLGILVLLGATIWALASRHGVNEYKARQPITSAPAMAARKTKTPPVFQATANTRIVRYGFDLNAYLLIREQFYSKLENPADDHNVVNVALAQFLYRPDEGVDSYLHVSAHIFLHKPDGTLIRPELYNPVWDADEPKTSKEFYAGHAHDLIVAVFRLKDAANIVLYDHDPGKRDAAWEFFFTPKIHDADGKDFFVKVDLIPKRFPSEPLPKQSFWFQLTIDPQLEWAPVNPPEFAK